MTDQHASLAGAGPALIEQQRQIPLVRLPTAMDTGVPEGTAAGGGRYGTSARGPLSAAASPNDLGGLLGHLDQGRSRMLALQLQRSAGNRATGLLLRPPPVSVQRCGAEVHEGCACAADAQRMSASATTSEPILQRQDPKPVGAPKDELKPDSPYLRLPGPLLATIKKSFNDRTMRFGHSDEETLDDVLDKMGTALLNALVKIYSRAAGLWQFVDAINWVWITDNWGFSFKAKGGDIGAVLKDNPKFCKDSKLGQIYHSGSECWREMAAGGAGLHVCLGKETSMHVDPHMPVKKKGGSEGYGTGAAAGAAVGAAVGTLFFGIGALPGAVIGGALGAAGAYATGGGESELGEICVYDTALWLDHASDVLSGKTGPDLFSRVDTANGDLEWLRKRIDFLPPSARKTRLAKVVADDRPRLDKILVATRAAASRPIAGDRPLDQQVGESVAEIEPFVPELEAIEADIARITPEVDELALATAPKLAGGAKPEPPPPPPSPGTPEPVPTGG